MKIVSVEQMKAIEARADAGGLTYAILMRNAGEGIGRWVRSSVVTRVKDTVLGLVGSGNNGGDALVALIYLVNHGWQGCAYLVRTRQPDDPLLEEFRQAGGRVIEAGSDPEHHTLASEIDTAAVLLDGILGTGARLPLEPEVARVLASASQALGENRREKLVVAVDCPSGMNCDDGRVAPETIRADVTLTMAAAKQGFFTFPAFEFTGRVVPVDIGISEKDGLLGDVKRFVLGEDFVRSVLPERPPDAHKGDFGTALLLVGSQSFTGAALLAGRAACRVGVGLVRLGVVRQVHQAIAGHLPEATWCILPDEDGWPVAIDSYGPCLDRVRSILVGCGWGTHEGTFQLLHGLLDLGCAVLPPMVVDADGLRLLARIGAWQSLLPPGSVLTPHPGEMAALTGMTLSEIQGDRMNVAENFARAWKQVVVLKGALTVISSPEGLTALVPVATPALAHAGTGDVLAGMIAGWLAQGVDAFQAACLGAYLHGLAGISAVEKLGNSGSVMASDIVAGVVEQISRLK